MQNLINTVPAEGQMRHSDTVSFLGDGEAPFRILILGNSITRHGPSEEIGWRYDWGMAASAPEKDYVHRLYGMLTESGRAVCMMIRQASHWERNFKDPECLAEYERERAFGADLVIVRLGENIVKADVPFVREALRALVSHVAKRGAKVLLTTGFWRNEPRDLAFREAAAEIGCPCVDIACEDESQMALGRFAHHGVAIHPGDEGMEMIAKRLFENIV